MPERDQDLDEAAERALGEDELSEHSGEHLPDREVMSLLAANVAIPVNAAVAANVLSDDATATAEAEQDIDVTEPT